MKQYYTKTFTYSISLGHTPMESLNEYLSEHDHLQLVVFQINIVDIDDKILVIFESGLVYSDSMLKKYNLDVSY